MLGTGLKVFSLMDIDPNASSSSIIMGNTSPSVEHIVQTHTDKTHCLVHI